jgi:hypothetical protein
VKRAKFKISESRTVEYFWAREYLSVAGQQPWFGVLPAEIPRIDTTRRIPKSSAPAFCDDVIHSGPLARTNSIMHLAMAAFAVGE